MQDYKQIYLFPKQKTYHEKLPKKEYIVNDLDLFNNDSIIRKQFYATDKPLFKNIISDAGIVVWTGPLGVYEFEKYKKNTDEYWAETITIAEAMKKLNEKEKMIISKRFFEGRTQIEVAAEIGISQAQVSRLEKNAIEHIKRIYKGRI